mmetsp:Transcript_107822/g.336277  ORF Transcript_107822/g.336277 Transcript_107822/m.336277 type:complete len:462 (+) Transcript_107822:816-2201(+)
MNELPDSFPRGAQAGVGAERRLPRRHRVAGRVHRGLDIQISATDRPLHAEHRLRVGLDGREVGRGDDSKDEDEADEGLAALVRVLVLNAHHTLEAILDLDRNGHQEELLVEVHDDAEGRRVEDELRDGECRAEPYGPRDENRDGDGGTHRAVEVENHKPGPGDGLNVSETQQRLPLGQRPDRPHAGPHLPQLPEHERGQDQDADDEEDWSRAQIRGHLERLKIQVEVVVDVLEGLHLPGANGEGLVDAAHAARKAPVEGVYLPDVVPVDVAPALHLLAEGLVVRRSKGGLRQDHPTDKALRQQIHRPANARCDRVAPAEHRHADNEAKVPKSPTKLVLGISDQLPPLALLFGNPVPFLHLRVVLRLCNDQCRRQLVLNGLLCLRAIREHRALEIQRVLHVFLGVERGRVRRWLGGDAPLQIAHTRLQEGKPLVCVLVIGSHDGLKRPQDHLKLSGASGHLC